MCIGDVSKGENSISLIYCGKHSIVWKVKQLLCFFKWKANWCEFENYISVLL